MGICVPHGRLTVLESRRVVVRELHADFRVSRLALAVLEVLGNRASKIPIEPSEEHSPRAGTLAASHGVVSPWGHRGAGLAPHSSLPLNGREIPHRGAKKHLSR